MDAKNGNTIWADAISKKLENVKVAFEILPDGKKAPINHKFMQCHMVFNITMDNSRCKARLVAGGHMTKALATIMTVRIV